MNLSLFSSQPEKSGFRLHSLEIWNWGTFDKEVFILEPQGETSLLTGANASGKTTLVDALLTLLVPQKVVRSYNQTVGSRGERSEETYLAGEYGETEDFVNNTRSVKKLRPDKTKTQSVLLAVFRNEKQFVTLAQARWYQGADLKKAFVIAKDKLSIAQDFSPFDSQHEWKKRLKQQYPKKGSHEVIYIAEGPTDYATRMRNLLGMRTEKAHSLFNKIIGLKVLGDLNEFVRQQMLEQGDSETEFQNIKAYLKTLNDAHRAIEKAYQQIEILTPIKEKYKLLKEKDTQLRKLNNHHEIAPYWFGEKQKKLIEEFLNLKEREVDILNVEIKETQQKFEEASEEERELDIQIKNDRVGNQISNLQSKEKRLSGEKREKEREMERYNKLAEKLRLVLNPQSAEVFQEQRTTASQNKVALESDFEKQKDNEFSSRKQLEDAEKEFEAVSNELMVLRDQKNNITGDTARIRRELLVHLGATEHEIPFIGELIKVKESEKLWESGIERLLHNFALRLIVPQKYYQSVNEYVKNRDLNGRIVYHRFNQKDVAPLIFHQPKPDELWNKLELKENEYAQWLENEIKQRYNYLCTDDAETFRLADKALTSSGLIKNQTKHEKDDRPKIKDRQRYVLGWDNKEKIALLKLKAERLNDKIRELKQNATHFSKIQKRIQSLMGTASEFVAISVFSKIDWWSVASELQDVSSQIAALQKTNNRVSELQNHRNAILENIKILNNLRKTKEKQLSSSENDIHLKSDKLRDVDENLQRYQKQDLEFSLPDFDSQYADTFVMDLNTIERQQKILMESLANQINALRDEIRTHKSEAENQMRRFRQPDVDIMERFPDWRADTHRLSESAEYIEEYVAYLEKVEKQELQGHKMQFKKYLNEEMITKMSDFEAWLERKEDDIMDSIGTLNKSLQKINYDNNPPTFIKLHVQKDYTPKVKDLKHRLKDWKPDQLTYQRTKDDQILEDSFVKIKSLLEYLDQDETQRKDLLDVRNWLKFKAVAHHREDPDKIERSFVGTAKLSGGEGAQLTYTILGSAIAYQFGIHSEGLNTNSFRFICVDEAFSKQDDNKARFLMELCRQLHLQVMVVSPAKAEDVAIVEPYIARVHFVQRKDNRNSIVYDMPIRQLKEQRANFLEVETS